AKIPVNEARYYPIYAKCCELEIPIVISTGPGTLVPGAVMEHASPRLIDYVARDFPELTVVISHGGYPWVNEAIMVTERNNNVYMELSEYERHPGAAAYIRAATDLISDKILYASAHPGADFRDALKMYDGFGFSQEIKTRIMHDNAIKVLGLNNGHGPA
ncbi:MAG: amidohydrolase family protein, partial [Desulfobacterales bacterium]|nr:amidohydrolase family protein [Desulfobacterales bacterium]